VEVEAGAGAIGEGFGEERGGEGVAGGDLFDCVSGEEGGVGKGERVEGGEGEFELAGAVFCGGGFALDAEEVEVGGEVGEEGILKGGVKETVDLVVSGQWPVVSGQRQEVELDFCAEEGLEAGLVEAFDDVLEGEPGRLRHGGTGLPEEVGDDVGGVGLVGKEAEGVEVGKGEEIRPGGKFQVASFKFQVRREGRGISLDVHVEGGGGKGHAGSAGFEEVVCGEILAAGEAVQVGPFDADGLDLVVLQEGFCLGWRVCFHGESATSLLVY